MDRRAASRRGAVSGRGGMRERILRDSGGEAFGLRQGFQIGDVSELLVRMVRAIKLDDVHVLEVGELAVNGAGR